MPEIVGVDMVQCGKCSEGFHVHCVHVPSEALEEIGFAACVWANFLVLCLPLYMHTYLLHTYTTDI